MNVNSNPLSTSAEIVEDLGEHITRIWMFDHQIVVYVVGAMTRPTIDRWVETVINDAKAWPELQPYLALYDSRIGTFTPYGGQRSQEMVKGIPPYLHGRVAVVISKNVFGQIIKNFVINRINRLIPNRETEFFFEYNEALQWLQQSLDSSLGQAPQ